MNKKTFSGKIHFLILLLLVLITLIFGGSFNILIMLFLGGICWGLIYVSSKKNENNIFAIIRLCVLSVPLSFVNIFGGSYSSLPLSWFNLFVLILFSVFFLRVLIKGNIHINGLTIISVLMIVMSIIPLLNSTDFMDGVKQYINIVISFILVVIATNLKQLINKFQKEAIIKDFILATEVAALGLFIQIFYVSFVGKIVGSYVLYGSNRQTYSFLFSDASFLSLFLSIGALAVYFTKEIFEKKNIVWLTEMGILILGSIITSARTGIFAFVAVFCLYSVIKFYKLVLKGSIKAVIIAVFSLAILIVSYLLMSNVRQSDLLNDSGRSAINVSAFNTFLENPLLGVGFGVSSYSESKGTIPHNIMYQSLAQGGLLYSIPLSIFCR